MYRFLFFSFLSLSLAVCADPARKTLLSSLDPSSVSQHLAFYDLYPETPEGQKALKQAWTLLQKAQEKMGVAKPLSLPQSLPLVDVQAIVSLVTRQPFEEPSKLSSEQLAVLEQMGACLKNRTLKGFRLEKKEQLLTLPTQEIDLARGLLLYQFEEDLEKIRQYEAVLDFMALQILARLPPAASPPAMIKAINRFIFEEMKFHFPPHSIYAQEIDLYTFLPSVLDSREGVCLGVSILYLSLAQRLGLPLEIMTPPGHIFLRYREGLKVINIETTARGINVPSEAYLGIDTRWIQQRNLREVIGLAFVNEASVAWGKNDFETTVALYEKALPFMPGDPLLNLFLGLNYLFVGKTKEGKALLSPLKTYTFDHAVSSETMVEDYFNKKVDAEGIKAIFMHVDETRESILEKQKNLQQVVKKYPQFRAGLFQLAVTWLQLGRGNEAKAVLEKYHALDPNYAVVEYYLSLLCTQRLDYNLAWIHLKQAEKLLRAREHKSKALRSLKMELRSLAPQ